MTGVISVPNGGDIRQKPEMLAVSGVEIAGCAKKQFRRLI